MAEAIAQEQGGMTLEQVAAHVQGEVIGDASARVWRLAPLDRAAPGELTHLSSRSWRQHLAGTGATAVILRREELAGCPVNAVVVDNPYLAYARLTAHFDCSSPADFDGIHRSAVVAPGAVIGSDVCIGPGASVAAGAVIGDSVVIGAGVAVGSNARIGSGSVVFANATVYPGVQLGERARVHANAVLGADGFGFTHADDGQVVRIHQLGGLRIGDDCEIGAGTTIDRGALDDTVIGNGVKIDNQVQIGHNCQIGDHTVICGCTGLVGSSVVGRHCVLAGGVGVGGDGPVTIADGTVVSGFSHVSESIEQGGGTWSSGGLIEPHGRWRRNALRFRELDRLHKRLRALEEQIKRIADSADSD